MLIIDIHVDTIENEKNPTSTSTKPVDGKQTKVKRKSILRNTGFWKTIKVSFPGPLNQQEDKNKSE